MFEPTRTNCTIDGYPAKTMFDRIEQRMESDKIGKISS